LSARDQDLQALLLVLDESDENDLLLKAEVYRELRAWPQAEALLNRVRSADLSTEEMAGDGAAAQRGDRLPPETEPRLARVARSRKSCGESAPLLSACTGVTLAAVAERKGGNT
jgi:hypothetical protein